MKVTVTIGEHERSVDVPETLLEPNSGEAVDQAEVSILLAFSQAYKAHLGGEPAATINVPDTDWVTSDNEVTDENIPLSDCICSHKADRHTEEAPGDLGPCQMDYAIDEKDPDGARGLCVCIRYEERLV